MIRVQSWLMDKLSRTLDPRERDIVLGDFAESGATDGRALREIVGLIVRRQIDLWKNWRPWLALFALVGLAGMLLFSIALRGGYELYFWIIRNYSVIDPALLEETGLTLRHGITFLLPRSFLLIALSWIGGFVLGSLSGRAIWLHVALFCLIWLSLSGALRAPSLLNLSTLLFLIPATWGVRQGRRRATLRLHRAFFFAAVLATSISVAKAADAPAAVKAPLMSEKDRKPAPNFTLNDASGKLVKLSDYRGKVVLLNFWATYCGGCKVEIPWFQEFENRFGPRRFAVLGVSMDEEWPTVKSFMEKARVTYRMLLDDKAIADKYALTAMPATFIIDQKGRIAATYVGLVDKNDVEANIKAVLAGR